MMVLKRFEMMNVINRFMNEMRKPKLGFLAHDLDDEHVVVFIKKVVNLKYSLINSQE